jgi:Tol biopolymer transport system component
MQSRKTRSRLILFGIVNILLAALPVIAGSCASGDPGMIAFLGPRDGRFSRIYSLDPETGTVHKLVLWGQRFTPYYSSWSADGKLLAYIDFDNDENGRYWLAVIDRDGTNNRRLFELTDLHLHSLTMVPDGKSIILSLDSTTMGLTEPYVTSDDPYTSQTIHDYDLFSFDINSRELTRLTSTRDIKELYPSCSPDGRMIAFVGRIDTEHHRGIAQEIYVMDKNGRNIKHLVHHSEGLGIFLMEFQWSPDSRYIVYSYQNVVISDIEDYSDIFLIDIKKGKLTNLTNTENINESNPVWSPGGSRLSYLSAEPESRFADRTVVCDLYDKSTIELNLLSYSWLPDGSGLIYGNPNNKSEILALNLKTGETETVITTGNIILSMPIWISQ